MPLVWLVREMLSTVAQVTRSLLTQAYHHIQKPHHPSNMPKSKSNFYFQVFTLQINKAQVLDI